MIIPNVLQPSTRPSITIELVWVTPEIASEWLACNTGNRDLSPSTVEMYSRDLVGDRWVFTGDPIRFDSNGRMIDGQHRCTMCVLTGKALWVLVIRGLDPAAQKVIDRVRRRSVTDALKMDGPEANATLVASTASLVYVYLAGGAKNSLSTGGGINPTLSESLELIDGDPLVRHAANRAAHFRSIGFPIRPSVIGVSFWLLASVDLEAAEEFFSSTAEMRTNGMGDPRNTLYRRFAAARDNKEQLGSWEAAFYIVRAWNAWRNGESLKAFKHTANGNPLPFPKPV